MAAPKSGHRAFLGMLLLGALLNPIACECDEQLTEITCEYEIETPDPNDSIEFPETAVGEEKVRGILVTNTGNTTLSDFQFNFSDVNGEHYEVGDLEEGYAVGPGQELTINVLFKPVAESTNLGSSLTLSHPEVRGRGCPSFKITVDGDSFERAPGGCRACQCARCRRDHHAHHRF
jgi:hypothetical protein